MTALSPHPMQVEQPLLQQAVTAIAATIQPQKIICFGMRKEEHQHWSCFTTSAPCTTFSYDLLVISNDTEKSKREAMAQAIQQHRHEGITLHAYVHSRAAVAEALQQGQPFFCRILTQGEVLYEKDAASLPAPAPYSKQALNDQEAATALQRAEEFLLAATHTATAGKQQLTFFLLHQAMEQAACALIKKYTGYLPATHRLERLLALVENCAPQILPFHRSTEAEHSRFTLLEQAYIGARYHLHYSIPPETVIIIQEQVKEFVTQASRLHEITIHNSPILKSALSPLFPQKERGQGVS